MPSDYRILVANYWVKGIEITVSPEGRSLRNFTALRLGGFDLELVRRLENFDTPVSQLRGGLHHTLDIIVRNVATRERPKIDRLVDEIIELLSFATMSQVCRIGHEFDGQISSVKVNRQTLYFRPTFGPTDGRTIKDFLEGTWLTYRRLRRKRLLNVVIDYVVTTELPILPIEFGMLSTFVTLECLKSTYAKSTGLKFKCGAWRKMSIPPKNNPKHETSYGFQALLVKMLFAVGMKKPLNRIVSLRNHIVHNGVSPRPLKSQIETGFYARDIIREYLLRLLTYRGIYRRYRGNMAQAVIS